MMTCLFLPLRQRLSDRYRTPTRPKRAAAGDGGVQGPKMKLIEVHDLAELKRDRVKVDQVEAVTLFSGDDGAVTRDVILVVSKANKNIVGVYQGWHGR
jgi:hypothetical protein